MTGEEVIKLKEQLAGQRTPLESHWDELCEIFTPFRTINMDAMEIIDSETLFDSTPRQSANIFVNGLCSLIVPREEQWFEFAPPDELKDDDDSIKWYRDCSEITLTFIEPSNFYEEIQESLFESAVFGTCSLYIGELDDYGDLCFLHQPIGSYWIGEDSKGRVNTLIRELAYTADQAAEEYGSEDLPQKIRALVGTAKGKGDRFKFYHVVTKRTGEIPKDAPESQKLPWVDIVVAEEGKTVVRRSGLNEFNFAVHRYSKRGKCIYGFGPGALAKGDSRQLSYLNELADVSTEKSVFPPLIAPASMEGEIGQAALDINYFDENQAAAAGAMRQLHDQPRHDILKDRLIDKREAVREAFHVDLFKLFSNLSKERSQMTATEAQYLASEKLTQFSPVYGRIMNEMIDVILARVFSVLYRAGKFPAPPPAVVQAKKGGRVRYRNRIALAMQAKENGALMDFFGIFLPVMQAFPEMGGMIFDSLKTGKAMRDLLRNAGLPERWLETINDYKAKQEGRAKAAAERAQLENAEIASKSAANMGKLPPNVLDMAAKAQ